MLTSLCHICGKPAKLTCTICGRPVCDLHYDKDAMMCTACEEGNTTL